MSYPLQVVQHDGLFRYLVRSEKREREWYLVDLEAADGFGQCSCLYFCTKIEPHLHDPERRKTLTPCKHQRQARWVLGNELIDSLIGERLRLARQLNTKRMKAEMV